jgi:hypothetical protein
MGSASWTRTAGTAYVADVRSNVWRRVLVAAGVGLALAAVACDPIAHSNLRVVSQPGSGVDFALLSGSGNFAVVTTSTGPERIDRRDLSVVALPTGTPTAISDDGSRVLLTSSTPVVWSNGVTITPPPGAHMSRDLTFGVLVDPDDGDVKTWETATQTVTDIETGFPRPAGTTSVQALDVSNDGRTIEYRLVGNTSATSPFRFVDLDANQKLDVFADVGELHLAPSGDAFLQTRGYFNGDPFNPVIDSWAELVSIPSGVAHRRYTSNDGFLTIDGHIDDQGNIGWVTEVAQDLCHYPFPDFCIVDSHVVGVMTIGARVFDLNDDHAAGFNSMSSNGRFFLYDNVKVADLYNGIETLNASPGPQHGYITDDGKLIATSGAGLGWYEFSAP